MRITGIIIPIVKDKGLFGINTDLGRDSNSIPHSNELPHIFITYAQANVTRYIIIVAIYTRITRTTIPINCQLLFSSSASFSTSNDLLFSGQNPTKDILTSL